MQETMMKAPRAPKPIKPIEILHEGVTNTWELVDGAIPKHEMPLFRSFLKALKSSLEDIMTKARKGLPLIGTHFAFPSELFFAYDCAPLCFEAISYLPSALFTEGAEPFYDLANNFGHPYHTCSAQKGVIGMALKDNFFDVDAIAVPTAPCDNTMASYSFFSEVKKVPTVVADMPTYHDKRGYDYFATELKNMVKKVGAIIGQEPNFEGMRKAVGHSSKAIEYLAEINDLRAAVPCPTESMLNPLGSCAQNFFAGRAEKENFYRDVRDVAKERVKKHEGPPGVDEKIRAFFPYMSVFFDVSLCEWMDREIGMVNVSDLFNYFFFDPIPPTASVDEIFNGLARQSMEYPMTRQSEGFVDYFLEDSVFLAKKFKADCAIFSVHIGCKQSVSVVQMIRETLRDEVGIPMLTLELDIGDKRMTPAETIKKKIEEFSKTLL
nr:2-hydroxyacyl-CoA dehydratase family protein [Candidatus Sigynarchaeum springense]